MIRVFYDISSAADRLTDEQYEFCINDGYSCNDVIKGYLESLIVHLDHIVVPVEAHFDLVSEQGLDNSDAYRLYPWELIGRLRYSAAKDAYLRESPAHRLNWFEGDSPACVYYFDQLRQVMDRLKACTQVLCVDGPCRDSIINMPLLNDRHLIGRGGDSKSSIYERSEDGKTARFVRYFHRYAVG